LIKPETDCCPVQPYPRRPGMPCSAARDHMRCEQGTRPGSRAWTRGRPGQRPRTWAQGGAATEQGAHGTYAKTANQRLSYCRWCWILPRTPQMPKRRVLAFGNTPNTQHTNCNTLPAAPHRPVLPPGSSLVSCRTSPAARRNQNGPTTPPKRRSAAGTALGAQLAAGGHFHGTWPPWVARSYPPFVTQRKSICAETQSTLTPLTLLRF
jgi:hypothetical protein